MAYNFDDIYQENVVVDDEITEEMLEFCEAMLSECDKVFEEEAEPVQPVQPTEPVQPVSPEEATEFESILELRIIMGDYLDDHHSQASTQLDIPVGSAEEPVQPVHPLQPSQQIQPTHSTQPIERSQPMMPVQPVQPFYQPVHPIYQPVPMFQPYHAYNYGSMYPWNHQYQPMYQPAPVFYPPVQPVYPPIQPVYPPIQPIIIPVQPDNPTPQPTPAPKKSTRNGVASGRVEKKERKMFSDDQKRKMIAAMMEDKDGHVKGRRLKDLAMELGEPAKRITEFCQNYRNRNKGTKKRKTDWFSWIFQQTWSQSALFRATNLFLFRFSFFFNKNLHIHLFKLTGYPCK